MPHAAAPRQHDPPTYGAVALRVTGLTAALFGGFVTAVLIAWGWPTFQARARQSDPPQATHGLVFPASATIHSHDVDPDVVRLDGGATTRLDLAAADLPAFLAQLNVQQAVTPPTGPQAFDPGWMRVRYECTSTTGDALVVDVGDPNQPVVPVRLYTDWN
jgi:hypothetical protein